MNEGNNYSNGEFPQWEKHSVHIIEELRRLSNQIKTLTEKMDEQQDEFHAYRMDAVKELNASKIENQKEINRIDKTCNDNKVEVNKEITRIDKELSVLKTKMIAITTGIAILINLIPFFWDVASKPEKDNAAKIEQVEVKK